jgi:hypothetical protein
MLNISQPVAQLAFKRFSQGDLETQHYTMLLVNVILHLRIIIYHTAVYLANINCWLFVCTRTMAKSTHAWFSKYQFNPCMQTTGDPGKALRGLLEHVYKALLSITRQSLAAQGSQKMRCRGGKR